LEIDQSSDEIGRVADCCSSSGSECGVLLAAQIRSAVRGVAITAAERNEVFGTASFRIVPELQKSAFGVGAHSPPVLNGSGPSVCRAAANGAMS
jgi:hypothetical protein